MVRLTLASALVLMVAGSVLAQPPRRPTPAQRAQRMREMQRRRLQQGGNRPERQPDTLQEGDMAPDFTLKSPDGKREVTLSDYRGEKPVALVFGSYT